MDFVWSLKFENKHRAFVKAINSPNKACTGRLVGSAFLSLIQAKDLIPFPGLVLPSRR